MSAHSMLYEKIPSAFDSLCKSKKVETLSQLGGINEANVTEVISQPDNSDTRVSQQLENGNIVAPIFETGMCCLA